MFHIHFLVDSLLREQRHEPAIKNIEYGLKNTETLGLKYRLPDLLRLKGICILSRNKADAAEAEGVLIESLELARQNKAKLWELRTAISLATLWAENKERQKAYDLLYPVYSWFTEGFETEDLKKGKTLLAQLR